MCFVVTVDQKRLVEECAQNVLDVRTGYSGISLAKLYDPETMTDQLLAAHRALDAAVEAAYGVDFGEDEDQIVLHLFELYQAAIADE